MKAQKTAPQAAKDTLATARTVLGAEADALRALAETLGDNFRNAVDILLGVKGRVVVSGMGKSGHIARKIAATLASTGTPALFVHPGEASHGDLGMIVKEDAVLALSNSGETAELSDLIAYTRRFGIPLIGITRGGASTLAEQADCALILPPVPEVCPMGLAPTTSTTMSLALGDALAVAVMECKGFKADDYRNFHPGGKLGDSLKRVEDIMHKGAALPLAKPQDTMAEVMVTITEKRFGCVGVVGNDGKLAGIITDGDLRRHMSPDLLARKAETIMTRDPMTIGPRMLAVEALNVLNEHKRTNVFVVDDGGKPLGIIHIHDLLRIGVA
ncbi:MAG: KpsF/GutQ family sugar-phosphate isomerase [Alphaproteobacteria bacterium]|nr:KpsF/GutQ family sugar-phosphate isomerase [Alphaproteobacteria bacterium]